MANIKITDLDAYTDPKSTDVLPAVDVTNDLTKKVSIADLMENAGSGTEALPGISFDGDPNTGIYRPGADQVAISTNGTGRLFVNSSGRIGIGGATAAAPLQINSSSSNIYILLDDGTNGRLSIQADTNKTTLASFTTGAAAFEDIELRAAQHIFSRSGSIESARIDSSGRLGLGTSSPDVNLHVNSAGNTVAKISSSFSNSTTTGLRIDTTGDSSAATITFQKAGSTRGGIDYSHNAVGASEQLGFNVAGGTDKLVITGAGNVGIGTTSPASLLHLADDTFHYIRLERTGGVPSVCNVGNSGNFLYLSSDGSGIQFNTGATPTEKARITSDGKLGLGTSSPENRLHIVGTSATTNTGATILVDDSASLAADIGGSIAFRGTDGSGFRTYGLIRGGKSAAGAGAFDGYLAFETRTNAQANTAERMRITSAGAALFNKTVENTLGATGIELKSTDQLWVTTSAAVPAAVNRLTDDGNLVVFYQDTSVEGSISVSGSTVSYNGAHLSRWSQLPGGAERTEILRGTVLSNIDEMCEWGEEENEQLNRMKVSDVEGDKNVSGVFQAWDDDDDTYTDDFYCAMTGDFIIRIAQGVTVERGDLLMSAGDGTAKPQDDDIIRSKTIAKVTSTHVSETYADGSYCVPCVLMAC